MYTQLKMKVTIQRKSSSLKTKQGKTMSRKNS